MPNRVTVKVHPDVQTENNVPDILPTATWIIGYRTSLFIDGQFVLKFKVSMLIRKDGETDPTYAYSRYMRFGFLPPPTEDEFYNVCAYCYHSAIIEFNKSLDTVFSINRFIDARFISTAAIKKMVDTALNPQVN
jgi:hypothetical protein